MKALILAVAVCLVANFAFGAEPAKPELTKEDVTFATSDGVTISAFFVPGKVDKAPAVVLVHMLGRSKEDWLPILEERLIPETPYAYIAIDIRGHGKSTKKDGKDISYKDFTADDWRAAVNDVEAAVKYLATRKDVNADKIAVIGASIGANLAINYAAKDPSIDAVVLLSAGIGYAGVGTTEALDQYGNRPVMVVAGEDDGPAFSAISLLQRSAKGRYAVAHFPGNLHGTRMFGIYPITKPIVAFLAEYLK